MPGSGKNVYLRRGWRKSAFFLESDAYQVRFLKEYIHIYIIMEAGLQIKYFCEEFRPDSTPMMNR